MPRGKNDQFPEHATERWAMNTYEALYAAFSTKKRQLKAYEKDKLSFFDRSSKVRMSIEHDQETNTLKTLVLYPQKRQIGEVANHLMPTGGFSVTALHPMLRKAPEYAPVAGVATISDRTGSTVQFLDFQRNDDLEWELVVVHEVKEAHNIHLARDYIDKRLPQFIKTAAVVDN